jgi:hypothetical protein
LSRLAFQECFDSGSEYYFIAFPRMKKAWFSLKKL